MNPGEFSNIAQAEREMWWFRGMREIIDAMLDSEPCAAKVRIAVEGGCGTGFNARTFADQRGWKVYPVDLSMDGLRYSRSLGVENAVCADVTHLPFNRGAFDAAISLDVLAHFEPGGESPALRELARVTRPGGLLVLRVSALNILRSRHSGFVNERQRFTRKRLRRAVESAGFRILRDTYANSLLLPVALFRFRIWETLTSARPRSGVALSPPWMERLLSIPLKLETAWIRRGGSLPLGQSIVMLAERLPD